MFTAGFFFKCIKNKVLLSIWLNSDVQWKIWESTTLQPGPFLGECWVQTPTLPWQLPWLCSVRQSRSTVTQLVTEEQDSRWALRLSPGLTVFWQTGTAACTLVIPCSESNVEQRGSVHPGTPLLGILEMRSSETHRPYTDTEHMPCYQPTEQHIMIPPTINS